MKTKLQKMIKSIKIFILLAGGITFAQNASVTGTVNSVQTDGLHRIQIPQKMRAYATQDLKDLRIWDAQGNQVSYFLQPASDYIQTQISDFTEFSIVEKTRLADSSSTYIFENPYKTIDKAVLLIANYQGSKNYRLEGSNDQVEWFGIVNRGQLNQLNHETKTEKYQAIYFPVGSYQFLKIVFDDRLSLPINLLKIGNAKTETVNIVPLIMEKIPVKSMDILETDKKTQIHIDFDRAEVIQQIRMTIDAPEFYNRNARLVILKEREVKRNTETYKQTLANFVIRSDEELIFNIPNIYERRFYLEIDNKDNPQLDIGEIYFMQQPVYLVASLKNNEQYQITAGNDSLSFPDYDIAEVTNWTKQELPVVHISEIVYDSSEKTAEETTTFWQKPWFMWACIGIAAILILYFAFQLIKDLNNDKKPN